MEVRWISDSTTARHIVFHTSEAADFWLRNVILGEERPRDRAEFTAARDAEELLQSIDAALATWAAIVERSPAVDAPVEPLPLRRFCGVLLVNPGSPPSARTIVT